MDTKDTSCASKFLFEPSVLLKLDVADMLFEDDELFVLAVIPIGNLNKCVKFADELPERKKVLQINQKKIFRKKKQKKLLTIKLFLQHL